MKISIIGTGYVGLVTGACFADLGFYVCCAETAPKKLESLNKGIVPFYEPGLEEMVDRTIKSGHLLFTSNKEKPTHFADIIFICVGTPQNHDGKPNLDYLEEYFLQLISVIKKDIDFMENPKAHKHLFIKSTIPPGTISHLNKILEINHLKDKLIISSNPEFLKEGSAIRDFMRPDRVVIGSTNIESIQIAKELYRTILWKTDRMLVTTPESAEIIKYAANSFLAMKISFINQIARLSDAIGGDIHEIRKGIGMDERINPHFLYAGLGYGGSCFPKDVNGLEYVLNQNQLSGDLITATNKVNKEQVDYFLNKIFTFYNPEELQDKEFAFWGLAFKPNTDDVRESVAIKLIKLLAPKVKKIYAYEPIAFQNASLELENFKYIILVDSAQEATAEAHALVIATEYSEFWNINPEIFEHLKDKCIFDGRNILDKEKIESAGIKYFGVGR